MGRFGLLDAVFEPTGRTDRHGDRHLCGALGTGAQRPVIRSVALRKVGRFDQACVHLGGGAILKRQLQFNTISEYSADRRALAALLMEHPLPRGTLVDLH